MRWGDCAIAAMTLELALKLGDRSSSALPWSCPLEWDTQLRDSLRFAVIRLYCLTLKAAQNERFPGKCRGCDHRYDAGQVQTGFQDPGLGRCIVSPGLHADPTNARVLRNLEHLLDGEGVQAPAAELGQGLAPRDLSFPIVEGQKDRVFEGDSCGRK